MNYPNGIKKETTKTNNVNYAHRGMDLEADLNITNVYYRDHDIAYIYKKPTPIKATKIEYQNNRKVITKGYFETPSTTDYNGIYKGYYLDFEAKVTSTKTSFSLSNLHHHQLNHLKNMDNHGGIAFLIIYFKAYDEVYLLKVKDINTTTKSIKYTYIKEHGYLCNFGLNPRLDYLKIIDSWIGVKNEGNNSANI